MIDLGQDKMYIIRHAHMKREFLWQWQQSLSISRSQSSLLVCLVTSQKAVHQAQWSRVFQISTVAADADRGSAGEANRFMEILTINSSKSNRSRELLSCDDPSNETVVGFGVCVNWVDCIALPSATSIPELPLAWPMPFDHRSESYRHHAARAFRRAHPTPGRVGEPTLPVSPKKGDWFAQVYRVS